MPANAALRGAVCNVKAKIATIALIAGSQPLLVKARRSEGHIQKKRLYIYQIGISAAG